MQTLTPLVVECFAWLPKPGGAAPHVMARAQYHVGYERNNPNQEHIDRSHVVELEVIHQPGELPRVEFDESWPEDLALEFKNKITINALCSYLSECGLTSTPDALLRKIVTDLIQLRS